MEGFQIIMLVVNCNEIRDLDVLYGTVHEETLPTSNILMAVTGQFFKVNLKSTTEKLISTRQ